MQEIVVKQSKVWALFFEIHITVINWVIHLYTQVYSVKCIINLSLILNFLKNTSLYIRPLLLNVVIIHKYISTPL